MKAPKQPKRHYVVVDDRFGVCFSATTFDRAAQRVVALLKGQADDRTLGNPGSYRIACVEAE